jgi:hypothetical protein
VLQSAADDEDLSLDLPELLGRLAQELQLSVLALSGLDNGKGRVFSQWEQIYLSEEAKHFVMAALHRDLVTAEELEQALALLFAQTQGFADVEDIRVLLESLVDDPQRQSMLAFYDAEHIQ